MGLEDLGDLVLQTILLKSGPKTAAVSACVSRRFRVSASDEDLWRKFCSQVLDLSTPEDPFGNPTPSFKVTYKSWNEGFGMYQWPLVRRVKKCWRTINNWLAINFPEAINTLRKGVSEAEINELEDKLGLKLPIPTRLLYRFCDGQDMGGPDSTGCALGLIGGYFFYEHGVNVYLLPLHEVIMETREFSQLGFYSQSKIIVVAASAFLEKMFFLNCTTGQLYVGTVKLATQGQLMSCVPDALIKSVHCMDDGQSQDAMLLWLEEHGRRLESGMIHPREGKIRSISLFPETSPLCSAAITNGVQIRASAVFVPELSDVTHGLEKYWFSYSIRMRLMPQGCMLDGVYFSSCQLYWRHWIIRSNDVVVSDVDGEAVIGKFPLLFPDGEEFVYESCAPLPSSSGSIVGAFTFVPGRLFDPKGRPFDVEVAQFALEVPDYIF
ncbi:hypothetical protein AAC387_Pa05g0577 [Persea americana]